MDSYKEFTEDATRATPATSRSRESHVCPVAGQEDALVYKLECADPDCTLSCSLPCRAMRMPSEAAQARIAEEYQRLLDS